MHEISLLRAINNREKSIYNFSHLLPFSTKQKANEKHKLYAGRKKSVNRILQFLISAIFLPKYDERFVGMKNHSCKRFSHLAACDFQKASEILFVYVSCWSEKWIFEMCMIEITNRTIIWKISEAIKKILHSTFSQVDCEKFFLESVKRQIAKLPINVQDHWPPKTPTLHFYLQYYFIFTSKKFLFTNLIKPIISSLMSPKVSKKK